MDQAPEERLKCLDRIGWILSGDLTQGCACRYPTCFEVFLLESGNSEREEHGLRYLVVVLMSQSGLDQ